MHGLAAGQRGARRPQGVVGAGDEDLVAVLKQRHHAELDELRDAVAGVDGVHVQVGQVLELGVLHDGLTRGEQAVRIGVALAVDELARHVLHDLVGRAEAEGSGVADVELEHVRARLLHAVGLVDHGAADVVEHVIELGRLLELAHGGSFLGGTGKSWGGSAGLG